MENSKIATLINTVLIPNTLGGESGVTIAEDLRNINDFGTAIADLGADDLKDAMKKFAIGVIENFFDTRSYKGKYFGLVMDSVEYGGAIQRTRAKLLNAMDTNIVSLEDFNADSSAPDYHDGHFYGTESVSKVFNKRHNFKVAWSISTNQFKTYFMTADGARRYTSMIENNAQNTLEFELETLAKSILRSLVVNCATDRTIPLITTYNTEMGFIATDAGYVKLTNWKQNADFLRWCQALIISLKRYMTDYNEKYNDGTVEVFCPEEDIRCVLLNEFDTALTFNNANVFHNELTSIGQNYTINYWQNGGEDLIPYIASGSVHDEVVQVTADTNPQTTTVSHVVGLVYDKYAAGITTVLDKTSSEYVGAEDFTTYFHHIVKSNWICSEASAVVLTLA